MKKLFLSLLAASLIFPQATLANKNPVLNQKVDSGDTVGNGEKVSSQPDVTPFTLDAMGCMILRECTDEVYQVFSLLDVSSLYDDPSRYNIIADEFNYMLTYLNQVGVDVFIAGPKNFKPGVRGLYHTQYNRFFLNAAFMDRPGTLMAVMRHEGWHAAQDCMGGSMDNSFAAIIKPEEDVPELWRNTAERTYPKAMVPWEAEAWWAGKTAGMTMEALRACASDKPMWEEIEPTPLTRKWLVEKGYIK